MGVYINMEMPPDGRYTVCITHDSNGGIHWVFQNQDTLEFLKHGAVTEVPEPHGRLIDESAIDLSKYEKAAHDALHNGKGSIMYDSGVLAGARAITQLVRRAPTIIPASEEG